MRPPVDEVRPGGGPSVKDNPQLVARVGNSEPSQIPLPISEVPQRNRGLAQALTTTGEENIGHFLVATIRPAGTARSPRARAKHPGKTGAGPPRAAALPTGSSPTPLCVTCWREEGKRHVFPSFPKSDQHRKIRVTHASSPKDSCRWLHKPAPKRALHPTCSWVLPTVTRPQ